MARVTWSPDHLLEPACTCCHAHAHVHAHVHVHAHAHVHLHVHTHAHVACIALFFEAVRKSTDLADGLTQVFGQSRGVLLSGRDANSP